MFKTPILFLIYNRPELTSQVFQRILEIQPEILFVAADGPKNKEDELKCANTRSIINCSPKTHVQTLFRDKNLGCGKAVSEAISWFFKHVDEGIILEDDCLPDTSFFSFAENLLKYYRHDSRIMHIGGNNFQDYKTRSSGSYYFSKYNHIWGWATWKRAWEKFEYYFEKNFDFFSSPELQFNRAEVNYWRNLFEKFDVINHSIWDYRWTFSIWSNNGISVLPEKNLVTNIGFGENSTHTTENFKETMQIKSDSLINLEHPLELRVNKKADLYTLRKIFSPKQTFINQLRNIKYKILGQ